MTASSTISGRVDRYPSRQGIRGQITDRIDPVVWGSGPGPLTAEQLASFEADGYLEIPGVFSAQEVGALNDALDLLAADPVVRREERTVVELDSDEVRSVFEVHRDGFFADLCADPRLADVARQVLADDVYIHQSRVNLKPGFRGREFYWHSDFETWHTEDGMPLPRAVSCSVSLTDNHHVNGPLMIITGSHKRFVSCAGETPPDHHRSSLRRQEIGVPSDEHLAELVQQGEIRDCIGPAGSVTFFDCNAMHGSNGNITPYPRRNAFYVYNSVDNGLLEPYAAPARRPNHIASRTFEALPR
ncbi:MAG: ectoine hydroxylase [Aquihabitans sp.]